MSTKVITTYDDSEFRSLIAACVQQVVKDELATLIQRPDQSQFLTRQETAQLLSISLPTLHDYTKRGIIIANRLGSKVRYRRNDVESALIKIKVGNRS